MNDVKPLNKGEKIILNRIHAALSEREDWTVSTPPPDSLVHLFKRKSENDTISEDLVVAVNYMPFKHFYYLVNTVSNDGAMIRSLNHWVNTRPTSILGKDSVFAKTIENIMRQRIILLAITPLFARILERERLLDYRDLL